MKIFKFSLVPMLSSLILLSVACQEGSSLVGPEKSPAANENQLDKKSHHQKNSYTVSKWITVQKGGKITLKTSYKSDLFGKKVKISAEIKFKPGTVTTDTEFTMTLDPESGMVSFSPAMTFNNVAPLTISMKGVDFKKKHIKKDELKFVYFDVSGAEVHIDSKKIWVKKDSFGILQAEIGHFSRYGFAR